MRTTGNIVAIRCFLLPKTHNSIHNHRLVIGNNRESFKEKYREIYPTVSKNNVANCAGTLFRFAVEMKIGDYVVFPSKSNREINIGKIIGNYYYDEHEKNYVHKRAVK